jgi:hypothetical protein
MASAAKRAPKPEKAHEDLMLIEELVIEQRDHALASARKDARGVSAFWIAKGDHLVLMVIEVRGKKAVRKIYKCRLLDFIEEEI